MEKRLKRSRSATPPPTADGSLRVLRFTNLAKTGRRKCCGLERNQRKPVAAFPPADLGRLFESWKDSMKNLLVFTLKLAPSMLTGGKLEATLNDSGTDGIAGKSGGVVDAQFLHEMPAMFFDGLRADA